MLPPAPEPVQPADRSGGRSVDDRPPESGDGSAWGLWLGVLAFLLLLGAAPLAGNARPETLRTAAVAALMAIWWMTEALPLAATALLPLVLLPALGIMSPADAAAPYANPVIFLFMGGFILALAMERWELHRRVALSVVAAVGTSPRRLVLGFMLATAFISMWISNTATAAMMLPIGMALVGLIGGAKAEEEVEGETETASRAATRPAAGNAIRRNEAPSAVATSTSSSSSTSAVQSQFGAALMLGIAYAATVGGVATLIGTPPNAVFAAAVGELVGREVSFADWLGVGLPVTLIMLPAIWALLVYVLHPPGRLPAGAAEVLAAERRALGPMSTAERLTLGVFLFAAAGWLLREPKLIGGVMVPGLATLLPGIDDSTIAIAAALLLFLLPAGEGRGRLMDWATARRLPWGVLLLFGGGLSLAAAFEAGGLTAAIGELVHGLAGAPPLLLVAGMATLFVLLSELASNTAVAAMAMPVVAGAAAGLGQDPVVFMAVAAIAASMAFMLPVGTPPNAIAFGTGQVRLGQMLRAGVWLNLLALLVDTFIAYTLAARLLD